MPGFYVRRASNGQPVEGASCLEKIFGGVAIQMLLSYLEQSLNVEERGIEMAQRQLKRSKRNASNLEFQILEPKNLLAGISLDPVSGVLTMSGSSADDIGLVSVQADSSIRVQLSGHAAQSFVAEDISEIVFQGGHGNDWFRNDSTISSRAYGQNGNDRLIGGFGRDLVNGGAGSDRVLGRAGNDYLAGGIGDDVILGGFGDDVADGQSGDDNIQGNEGNDLLRGGAGLDHIRGNDGNDFIAGNNGDDTLFGNEGSDRLFGDEGADWIYGSEGADRLIGGSGSDVMFGYFGADVLFGGDGHDRLYGQDHADILYGGAGNDDVRGGNGNDFLRGGDGDDDLHGQSNSDNLNGQNGDDNLSGGSDSDVLRGGAGNDDFDSDSSDSVFDDRADYDSAGDFELYGEVVSLNSGNRTMVVNGLEVDFSAAQVKLSLSNGVDVKVEGTFDGTKLIAREVERDVEVNRRDNVEAHGIVVNHNAAARTFSFLGLTVDYSGGERNGIIEDGRVVKVEGNLVGTTIVAREVESIFDLGGGGDQGGGENELDLRGRITNLDTTTQTFQILGVNVSYSGSQIIGQIANGNFVKVDGRMDGSLVVAREIERETDDDRDENISVTARIASFDAANSTFEFLGFTVDYSNARVRQTLGNGVLVEVDGWFENGFIDAEEVR